MLQCCKGKREVDDFVSEFFSSVLQVLNQVKALFKPFKRALPDILYTYIHTNFLHNVHYIYVYFFFNRISCCFILRNNQVRLLIEHFQWLLGPSSCLKQVFRQMVFCLKVCSFVPCWDGVGGFPNIDCVTTEWFNVLVICRFWCHFFMSCMISMSSCDLVCVNFVLLQVRLCWSLTNLELFVFHLYINRIFDPLNRL